MIRRSRLEVRGSADSAKRAADLEDACHARTLPHQSESIRQPSAANPEHRASATRPLSPAGLAVLCAVCLASVAAAAPESNGWQHLVSGKVLACGIAVVALLILSLLLRGLLKVISLALVVVLAAGMFWYLRDAWLHKAGLVPRDWAVLAEQTLNSPKARGVWESLQAEISKLPAEARAKLAAGTDEARRVLIEQLEARARKLRKEGGDAAAGQIAKFAALLEKQR